MVCAVDSGIGRDGRFAGLYLVVKNAQQPRPPRLRPPPFATRSAKRAKIDWPCRSSTSRLFGDTPLAESFRRLDRFCRSSPGTQVIDAAWGFGTVKRLDDFYKRITVDFAASPVTR
jgi:hypothetical protein